MKNFKGIRFCVGGELGIFGVWVSSNWIDDWLWLYAAISIGIIDGIF